MTLSKTKIVAILMAAMMLVGVASGCAKDTSKNNDDSNTAKLSGTVNLAGSTSIQPLAEDLGQAFMQKNPDVRINVAGGGSGAGIKAAQDGTADIGTCSRELTDDEKGTVQETMIAKDGIAIVVNSANTVEKLTSAQVKDIFSGKIKNWKDVGGKSAPINLFTREEGSGTRDAFTSLVMGDAKIDVKANVQNSTGAIRTAVAGDANSISYMSLGDMDNTVKALVIDGITPSKDTVSDGTYKLQRPFLLLTKDAPTGVTKAFLDYILSAEGQQIVDEAFVKVK